MKAVLEKIGLLSKNQKIGIALGSYVVIGLGFWQFFYSSTSLEVSELQEKIEELEVSILERRRVANNLPAFREEVKKLDKKLDKVLLELPDKKEVDGFLKSISVLAYDTGLEVTKFSPSAESPKDFFSELPVQIELQGTFHELATFFDEVAHLPRIVNIDDIKIVILTETPTEVLIKASCRATTFRYLEEYERNNDDTEQRRRK